MGFFGRDTRPSQFETLENAIGATSSFQGTLRSDGGVRIDGAFEGIIEVAGNVVIGEGARVVADITARDIVVGGAVKGNIDGTGQLQILSTGQVLGDIAVSSVMIDEGGVFQGTSRMRGFDQRALAPPEADAVTAEATDGTVGQETLDVEARPAPDIEPEPEPEAEAETVDTQPEPEPKEKAEPELDLDSIDIEPIIPDVVIEEVVEEEPEPAPKRTSRRRSSRTTRSGNGK